jgi:5'-3' exonuclease
VTKSSRPLLAVDGDSLAHRAYHALPKTIRRAEGRPAGALVGFANMLLRLWEAEAPRAILVGWDSLESPTYRHEAFEGYQAGREFDAELLEQLELLPELAEALGFACAKAPGYEADDFLAAAVSAEEKRGGFTLVATSDRDAFQLAGDRTTILQPVRGVSELTRIGPAEVRERYGVEPVQVPDFIALRGDPSDRLPGARGVGPKTAADLLRQYGSLEAALADGRFAAEAEELRLYRRIATLDASAPLPSVNDQTPRWAEASATVRDWGLNQLADRLAAEAAGSSS